MTMLKLLASFKYGVLLTTMTLHVAGYLTMSALGAFHEGPNLRWYLVLLYALGIPALLGGYAVHLGARRMAAKLSYI